MVIRVKQLLRDYLIFILMDDKPGKFQVMGCTDLALRLGCVYKCRTHR